MFFGLFSVNSRKPMLHYHFLPRIEDGFTFCEIEGSYGDILNYNSQPIGFFTKNLKNQGQKQEISKVSPEL